MARPNAATEWYSGNSGLEACQRPYPIVVRTVRFYGNVPGCFQLLNRFFQSLSYRSRKTWFKT